MGSCDRITVFEPTDRTWKAVRIEWQCLPEGKYDGGDFVLVIRSAATNHVLATMKHPCAWRRGGTSFDNSIRLSKDTDDCELPDELCLTLTVVSRDADGTKQHREIVRQNFKTGWFSDPRFDSPSPRLGL